MSGMALIWAANVKGLKPAAKIVLIQLADFHNKETGQCNPSAQRLANECEMGRATLFRHLSTLEQFGLVTRHAQGDGDGGRSANQYELHLDISLGPSSRTKRRKPVSQDVESQNGTRGKVSEKSKKSPNPETGAVSNRDTNLTNEPRKEPPTRARVEAEASDLEMILALYPSDRVRDAATSKCLIAEALSSGVPPDEMIGAVKAYAAETEGFTRSKVCFSDNWFRGKRWKRLVKQVREQQLEVAEREAKHFDQLVEWIKCCHWMCKHITIAQAGQLLLRKMITADELRHARVAF